MPDVLILNLGTQEPRWNVGSEKPDYQLLSSTTRKEYTTEESIRACYVKVRSAGAELGGHPSIWEFDRPNGPGRQSRHSFVAQCLMLLQAAQADEDGSIVSRISFPIVEDVLRHWRKKRTPAGDLGCILIACTKAGAHEETSRPDIYNNEFHPAHNDSFAAARLLKHCLKHRDYLTSVLGDGEVRLPDCYILKFPGSSHRFAPSRNEAQNLLKNHSDNIREAERVWVSQSPGLPAINSALLAAVSTIRSRPFSAFQVDAPDEEFLKLRASGRHTIEPIDSQFYSLYAARERLRQLWEHCDFRGGRLLLDEILNSTGCDSGLNVTAIRDFRDKVGELAEKWQPVREFDAKDLNQLIQQLFHLALDQMWRFDVQLEHTLAGAADPVWHFGTAVIGRALFERLEHLACAIALNWPEMLGDPPRRGAKWKVPKSISDLDGGRDGELRSDRVASGIRTWLKNYVQLSAENSAMIEALNKSNNKLNSDAFQACAIALNWPEILCDPPRKGANWNVPESISRLDHEPDGQLSRDVVKSGIHKWLKNYVQLSAENSAMIETLNKLNRDAFQELGRIRNACLHAGKAALKDSFVKLFGGDKRAEILKQVAGLLATLHAISPSSPTPLLEPNPFREAAKSLDGEYAAALKEFARGTNG